MKPFKLKRRSWHYWLASSGDRYITSGTPICAYFWLVVYGILHRIAVAIFFTAMATLAVVLVLMLVVGPVAMWFLPDGELKNAAQAGAVMDLAFAGLTLAAFGPAWLRKLRWRDAEPKQPGFVTLAYRAFKGKVCFKIDLE